jgi:hypothetical protein
VTTTPSNPTALVNEVYLSLLNQRKIASNDCIHFFVFSARMMRSILKDHVRAHIADRRCGPDTIKLPLSDELAWVGTSPEQLLDLNPALDRLELMGPPQGAARRTPLLPRLHHGRGRRRALHLLATAERDLKFSRSWLHNELNYAGRAGAL